MTKMFFAFALAGLLVAICLPAGAQQRADKISRLAIVVGDPNPPNSSIEMFRQALQEVGYVEGKNILIEYRYTEGNRDRVAEIVAELVRLKVDVLFSTQAIVIRAAKQATKTIPIVMAITPDPVAAGLVSEVTSEEGLDEAGLSLAKDMLRAAPDALRLTKRTLDAALEAGSYDAGMEIEERAQMLMIRSRMKG